MFRVHARNPSYGFGHGFLLAINLGPSFLPSKMQGVEGKALPFCKPLQLAALRHHDMSRRFSCEICAGLILDFIKVNGNLARKQKANKRRKHPNRHRRPELQIPERCTVHVDPDVLREVCSSMFNVLNQNLSFDKKPGIPEPSNLHLDP